MIFVTYLFIPVLIGSDKKCAIDIAASLWCRMVVVYNQLQHIQLTQQQQQQRRQKQHR